MIWTKVCLYWQIQYLCGNHPVTEYYRESWKSKCLMKGSVHSGWISCLVIPTSCYLDISHTSSSCNSWKWYCIQDLLITISTDLINLAWALNSFVSADWSDQYARDDIVWFSLAGQPKAHSGVKSICQQKPCLCKNWLCLSLMQRYPEGSIGLYLCPTIAIVTPTSAVLHFD